jgi:hypothetical protein
MLLALPHAVHTHVLDFLDCRSLVLLARVSKALRSASGNELLWRMLQKRLARPCEAAMSCPGVWAIAYRNLSHLRCTERVGVGRRTIVLQRSEGNTLTKISIVDVRMVNPAKKTPVRRTVSWVVGMGVGGGRAIIAGVETRYQGHRVCTVCELFELLAQLRTMPYNWGLAYVLF